MKKENLKKFKEIYEVIEDKAIEIAEIKNKYNEYSWRYWDETKFEYSGGEFGVKLIERGRCGASDDWHWIEITDEDLLSELDELEAKYKAEFDLREAEKAKIEEEKKEKERLTKEKSELELFKKLKEKYEN